MPPLYRVDVGKEVYYALDESERKGIIDRIEAEKKKGKVTVTRFKGLGEISPREFGQFIGKDMRLLPVAVRNLSEVAKVLDFVMGKNTKERRDFIVDNLATGLV